MKPRAGEVEKPRSIQQMSVYRTRERRSQDVTQYSAEESAPQEHSHNSDACAIDHRAAVQEKTERNGTREVLPRTTTTLVVLKASAYHTQRGDVPETETEQLSNKRLHPKDGRITARLFSLLFNSVFSPQRQPNQMLTRTQRGWFCFL